MTKFSPTNPLFLRTSLKESSAFLGSGFWRGNQILIVCIMSGVLTLLIVLLGDYSLGARYCGRSFVLVLGVRF
jgi:hypothetical protein